eukprot:223523_1
MGLCNATQNISRKQKLNFCDTQQLKVFGFVHQTYNEHIPQDILLLIVDYAMQIPIDSTILNEEEQEYLHKLIISQPQTMQFECSEWNLLCRGSRDGIKQKVLCVVDMLRLHGRVPLTIRKERMTMHFYLLFDR